MLAYISLAKGLQLLLGLAGDGVVVALTAQDYIGFVLSPAGRVRGELRGAADRDRAEPGRRPQPTRCCAESRRWIFFLTIVFAAFVTPTQDPFTMLLMAGPMIVLFEGAIQIARVVDKRRAKREAVEGFHDLDDDEASPLDAAPVVAGRRLRPRPPTALTLTVDVAVLVSPAAGRGRARRPRRRASSPRSAPPG